MVWAINLRQGSNRLVASPVHRRTMSPSGDSLGAEEMHRENKAAISLARLRCMVCHVYRVRRVVVPVEPQLATGRRCRQPGGLCRLAKRPLNAPAQSSTSRYGNTHTLVNLATLGRSQPSYYMVGLLGVGLRCSVKPRVVRALLPSTQWTHKACMTATDHAFDKASQPDSMSYNMQATQGC